MLVISIRNHLGVEVGYIRVGQQLFDAYLAREVSTMASQNRTIILVFQEDRQNDFMSFKTDIALQNIKATGEARIGYVSARITKALYPMQVNAYGTGITAVTSSIPTLTSFMRTTWAKDALLYCFFENQNTRNGK